MDTLADRLTKALNELAPLDVRGDKKALTGAMSERMESPDKRPGTSYPSVLGYFAGRTQPSLDWIAVAALVMGVRKEWLAFGGGLATEAEERIRIEEEALSATVVTRADLGRRWTADLSRALEEELGGRVPRVAHAIVAHHWRRLQVASAHIPARHYSGEELLRKLAKALVAPLREFDDDERLTRPLGALSDDQRGDYLMGIVPVVASAIERRFHIEHVAEITKTLVMKGPKNEEDTDG